ncbi:kinase-like domain-containing protein, partial [Dichotomocladium elegans]
KLYALKTFRKRPKTVSIRSYLKMISSEYCIASVMDHPNVVKTFDLTLDRKTGQYFTTMEYCDKEDLCTAIARNTLSIDQKKCFMRQILDGVAYLHSIGIAHRDLKPENLLIHDRFIKITDFGVASVMRDCWHRENQRCYGLCGTVCYAAPEVFAHGCQDGYLGDKADMWSVGTIFYVLLVGGLLFESAKMTIPFYRSYLRHHAIRRVIPFDRLGKGPDELLYCLLDPDPVKRYSAKSALSMPWVRAIPTCEFNSPKYPHSHR